MASHLLNRETLSNGTIRQMAMERDGPDTSILNDDELLASRRAIIPDDYSQDVWVFAYGSLIWNPMIEFSEQAQGKIFGYHRRFCLRTKIGRGSPELPGLILGLDNGGACTGLVLRIDKSIITEELDLLWKREMINRSYTPRKVKFHANDGRKIEAITFVMNHESPSYVRDMPFKEKAYIIANAKGFIGTSLEYLDRTYDSLKALGIHDGYLERLKKLTAQY